MPQLSQVSFTGGEVSPSLYARVDLARYATSLRLCKNFFVLATGGISNRAGLEFVAALNANSMSNLIPFVYSTEQAYMLVFQEHLIQVYANRSFVVSTAPPIAVNNVTIYFNGSRYFREVHTATPHGFSNSQQILISGVVATGQMNVNGSTSVAAVTGATSFIIGKGTVSAPDGLYTSGGEVSYAVPIETNYSSSDLAALRYAQSSDDLTITHQSYAPSEFVRIAPNQFSFGEISDFTNGPFGPENISATTMTADGNTGTITLTASAAYFTEDMIGSVIRLDLEDISQIQPWEASKLLAADTINPEGILRRSLGKVYKCATNEVASGLGTFTGTLRPTHDEGIEEDGDGNPIEGLAERAGVEWEYLHSFFGIAKITAVAEDGLTATADVVSYMPVVSPVTTSTWSLGAWGTMQGYPKVVTYYGDRRIFANTPSEPQTQWGSKVGEYSNFGESTPLIDDDAIEQTLNARQANPILELIPADQLLSLTARKSYASPARGEVLTPSTIGFFPQSNKGAADLRAVEVGDYGAIFAMRHARKIGVINYTFDADKFGSEELTVLARHLFRPGTIVDMDYAEEPDGILWIIRSDGKLIGLTYLPEQQVIGWHQHETDGFFERVCVIPEDGRDAVYFVVRRVIDGATVRYLERLASRDFTNHVDGFFVDSGLTYDGRNTTNTTIRIDGTSYDGGDDVSLISSASLFNVNDVGDAILFGQVRATIKEWISGQQVTAMLETPVPESLRGENTTNWTFARNVFTGLDHIEGKEVAICADGMSLARQTVSNGQVQLPQAFGVVHIGLPYTATAETLEVTVFGSPTSVRDRPKNIPSVTVVVDETVGLKIGPDVLNLEDLKVRNDEYYTDSITALSGTAEAYIANTWNDSGRIVMQQSDPLPATILAVIPDVKFGT